MGGTKEAQGQSPAHNISLYKKKKNSFLQHSTVWRDCQDLTVELIPKKLNAIPF